MKRRRSVSRAPLRVALAAFVACSLSRAAAPPPPGLWTAWLALGHYEELSERRYRSRVADRRFFLAPDGRTRPERELEATLAAFDRAREREGDDDPRCHFPARYALLSSYFPGRLKPPQRCPKLEHFLAETAPLTVRLVFASNFVSSPESAFGHTLLRLEPGGGNRGMELLDIAVNFSADLGDIGPLGYFFTGPIRRFEGHYEVVPFHVKIKEYAHTEQRDLWSYELLLTAAERALLVRHLWEIRGVDVDYYFVTYNCSDAILGLLDAAAPRLGLHGRTGAFGYPVNTLRVLFEVPGLVRRVDRRPSLASGLAERLAAMDPATQEETRTLVGAGDLPAGSRWSRPALQASLDYLQLRYPEALAERAGEEWAARRKRAILGLLVAASPEGRKASRSPPAVSPEHGHRPFSIGAYGGANRRQRGFVELALRPTLHGLLDPQGAAPIDGELELMSAIVRYTPLERHVGLQSLSIFRISAFPVAATLDFPIAYRFDAGALRADLAGCTECLTFGAETALGLSSAMFARVSSIYALGTVLGGVPVGRRADRLAAAVGSTLGLRVLPSLTTSAAFELRYRRWVLPAREHRLELWGALRQTFGALGFELGLLADTVGFEPRAGALYYF